MHKKFINEGNLKINVKKKKSELKIAVHVYVVVRELFITAILYLLAANKLAKEIFPY